MANQQTAKRERDVRIDFFRGLALIVMSVDHAEQLAGKQVLSYLTYAPIGISTAAEVFIFLSGFTLGIAFQPIFESRGYLLLQCRCLARAWQLYLMHAFCLLLTVTAITLIPSFMNLDSSAIPVANSIKVGNSFLTHYMMLSLNPTFFDILPLYIILLIFTPTSFLFFKRSFFAGMILPIFVYAAVQWQAIFVDASSLPFHGVVYYNPLAWQLLFTIGIGLGIKRRRTGQPLFSLSLKPLLVAIVFLVICGVWYKLVRLNVLFGWFGSAEYTHGMTIPFDLWGIDKPTLGILRLTHFLVAAAVVAILLPPRLAFWDTRASKPLLVIGRNALEVFVTGIILNYAFACVFQGMSGGRGLMLLLDAITILILVIVAYLVDWRKTEPWRVQ